MTLASFHAFFSGCASVAGALIGLLFVAMSVSTARLTGDDARRERQIGAAVAFSALVNALVIALVGLLPRANLGEAGLVLAAAGLTSTVSLIIVLYREPQAKVRRGDLRMMAILLLLYALQLANAIPLNSSPGNADHLNNQALLVIIFFIFGIARSWQLVGERNVSLVAAVAAVMHRQAGPGQPEANPESGTVRGSGQGNQSTQD